MTINRQGWIAIACILLTTVCVRLVAIWVGYSSLEEDPDSYRRLAVAWSRTGTYGLLEADGVTPRPTAYRPPLYPWILSWLVTGDRVPLAAIAAVHLILGCATVWLTLLVGVAARVRWAWFAALAVALDPLLIRASQQVMTETLATFLAVSALYCWSRLSSPSYSEYLSAEFARASERRLAWIVVLGAVLGLSILARPTAAPWAFWLALLLMRAKGNGSHVPERAPARGIAAHDRTLSVILCCLAVGLTILPWTVRNWLTFGKPIWATTHGGYTLLLANNPSLYEHFAAFGPSRAWNADGFHAHWAARGRGDATEAEFWSKPVIESIEPPDSSEMRDDQLAYRAAWATIKREPAIFAVSCLYRVLWLWMPFPYQAMTNIGTVAIGIWYSGWFLAAAVSAIRIGPKRYDAIWLAVAGLILSLTLIHAIFWSNMRMRAPAMPAIYLLACAACGGLPREAKSCLKRCLALSGHDKNFS